MPIKGEQHGYTYKVLINGEWQEVTIQESPLELVERFEQDEEWTRVRHGHWLAVKGWDDDLGELDSAECSVCHETQESEYWAKTYYKYCPNCGAKMDGERKEDAETD